jgi:hypothetical protein
MSCRRKRSQLWRRRLAHADPAAISAAASTAAAAAAVLTPAGSLRTLV